MEILNERIFIQAIFDCDNHNLFDGLAKKETLVKFPPRTREFNQFPQNLCLIFYYSYLPNTWGGSNKRGGWIFFLKSINSHSVGEGMKLNPY